MARLSAAVVRAVSRSLLKSLVQSALLIGASLLLALINPILGILFGVLGSVYFLLRSFHREWRLSWFTCLLPAFCSVGCLLLQLAFLQGRQPSATWAAGLLPGMVAGWLSGHGHKLVERKGWVFTKRTSLYLLVWVACFVVTQASALFGLRRMVELGLVGSGFSTVMVVTMSLVLFGRYLKLRRPPEFRRPAGATAALVVLIAALGAVNSSAASAASRPGIYSGGLDQEKLAAALAYANEPPTGVAAAVIRTYHLEGSLAEISATEARVQVNADGSAILLNDVEYRWTEGEAVAKWLFSPLRENNQCWRSKTVPPDYENEAQGVAKSPIRVEEQADGTYLLWMENSGFPSTAGKVPWRLTFQRAVSGGLVGFVFPLRELLRRWGPIDFTDPVALGTLAIVVTLLLATTAMNLSASLAHAQMLAAEAAAEGDAAAVAAAASLPPVIDPETGQPLLLQDGGYEGGRLGQVLYHGQWMGRGEAERRIRGWEEANEADRQEWYKQKTEEWQQGVEDKWAREGYEYDRWKMAMRKPPEFSPMRLPYENGDAATPDLVPGWFSYSTSNKSLENRYKDWEDLERKALDRYRAAHDEYQKANESGDTWLAQKWRENLDKARQNVLDVQGAKNTLRDRVDQLDQRAQGVQRGIDGVTVGQTWHEVWHAPIDMFDAWKNDPAFVQTMKSAIAARNQLQQDLDMVPELSRRQDDVMAQIRDLADKIKAARQAGDVQTERTLRAQAEPLKDALRQLQTQFTQVQEDNRKWQRQASEANLAAYRKTTDMVLAGTQVPETSKLVNSFIDTYRRRSIPGAHGHDMVGEDTGWSYRNPDERGWVGQKDTGWSHRDIHADGRNLAERALDEEHFRNVADADKRVQRWVDASTPEENRRATLECLDSHQAKLQQRCAPADLQRRWAADVENFRNKPLFEDMAQEANKRGWKVRDGEDLRPVEPGDFRPVRGPGTPSPGQDLDIVHGEIVDPKTDRLISSKDIHQMAHESCRNLSMDPVKQEIKVVGGRLGSTDGEAFPIVDGAAARTMYRPENVKRLDGFQAEQAYRVTEFKGAESHVLGPADSLAERCRTSIKDHNRVTKQLMEAHPGSKVPLPINDEAMKVMRQVGSGALPPGTGNNRFRQLTGMDLSDGCHKLNSMQESVVKLDPAHTGGTYREPVPDASRWGSKEEFERIGRELAPSSPAERQHHAQLQDWAEQIKQEKTPAFPDRKVPAAEGWPAEHLDGQKWPGKSWNLRDGSMQPYDKDGLWWPRNRDRSRFETVGWPRPEEGHVHLTEQDRWKLRDIEKGVAEPPDTRSPLMVGGVIPTPQIEQLAAANPRFRELDASIREAWSKAAGGHVTVDNPEPWNKFVQELDSRGINWDQYDAWQKAVKELKWDASAGSTRTVAPGAADFSAKAADFEP